MSSASITPPPRWVRVVTVLAVIAVAGVAAVVSYAHQITLGEMAGEDWRAHILPLSVDGLLVAASMVILVRRRAGLPAGMLPWLGLALGVAASLAANIAAAEPTALGRVVAAWPPIAFAVSFELLVVLLRDSPAGQIAADPTQPTNPAQDDVAGRVAALVTNARDTGQRPPGRRRLAAALGVSEHAVRAALSRNGDQPGVTR